MGTSGQKTSTNPVAKLSFLTSKRKKLQEELRNVEKQVYELETTYLQDSTLCGSVFKGFEGSMSSSKAGNNLKRPRKFQPEDRIFSLSSITSPAVEEEGVGRDDIATARTKGGGLPASGGGKPRKGRLAPKDGRRLKLSSEQHVQNEDDAELGNT